MRPFASPQEQQRQEAKNTDGWGAYLKPDSVLIAAMGAHWSPMSWAKVADMVAFTNQAGIYCGLIEVMDRCSNPLDAMGTMRNEAIMLAKSAGYEYLCYVDNDVLPEPDTLVRLIQRQVPIIVPFIPEPGTARKLHGPERNPNTGVWPMKWSVLSMLLFWMPVFNSVGERFWSDAIGADEGFHFQALWCKGHRLYMDTDVQVVTTHKPNYPLQMRSMTKEQREAHLEGMRERLRQPPDRRAIMDGNPKVINGIYMPFINQPPAPPTTVTTGTAIEPQVIQEVSPT